MAAADTARLLASLELQDKTFSRGIDNANRKLAGFEKNVNRVGVRTIAAGAALGGIIDRALSRAISIIPQVIEAGSSLAESQSKAQVVFGASSKAIEKWADTAATAFGQSKQQALEAAGTYGNLFQAFGVGADQSADMSKSLVQLAADLASFNNTSVDDALLALRSGLSGETEPLKRFGVALSVERIKLEAVRLGLIKTTKEGLTPAIKAQASYALIMKDTALAQGDFARTSGGLANQQRILRAQFTNIAATLGTALLPKVTELVTGINDLVVKNQPAIKKFADALPGAFDRLVGVVKGIPWGVIGESLKTAAFWGGKFFEVFTNLPPQVQSTIIALAGLNKLTGGAVSGIIADLGKGLIKGILGIQAAQVNIQAANVSGLGAPGAASGAGGGSRLLNAVKILGAVTIATASIVALAEVFNGLQSGFKEQTKTISDSLAEQFKKSSTADLQKSLAAVAQGIADVKSAAQPFGPLGGILVGDTLDDLTAQMKLIEAELARRREEGFTPPTPATGGVSPDERAEREAATAAWLALRDRAIEIGKGSPLTTLKTTTVGIDAVALADAMTTTTLKGWGTYFDSFENQKGLLASIEASQKTFLAQGDTVTAAKLGADIDALKAFMAGNSRDGEILKAAHETKEHTAKAVDVAIDTKIIAAANARTAMENAKALKATIDRTGTDARIIAAAAARTALENKAATLQVRDAIDRKKFNVTTNVTVNTGVSATLVQDTIKKVNTWQSTNTINTLGYGIS